MTNLFSEFQFKLRRSFEMWKNKMGKIAKGGGRKKRKNVEQCNGYYLSHRAAQIECVKE